MVKLISLEEFCEITGHKKSTVYKNNCLERYPFKIISCGRRLRFRESDVERWIAEGCPYLEARKIPKSLTA